MPIGPDSLITVQSVSPQAAFDKLAGTPMQPYAQLFIDLSLAYNIDLNWILSYLQWENGFGAANDIFSTHHDPWDLLCSCGSGNCSYPGCIGCRLASNGYCYYAFDNNENGIQAGYINWQSYVARGWNTWFNSLSVALCGNPNGCSSGWVNNVIVQGDLNSRTWPVSTVPLAVSTTADRVTARPGETVTFTATPSGGQPPYAFMWNFGDGVIIPGPATITHAYAAEGTYWAGAQIHDSAGGILNSDAVPIVVVGSPGGFLGGGSGIAALGLGLVLVGGAYYVWKTWG